MAVQQKSLKLSVYNVNHVVGIIKKKSLLHTQIIIEITEIKSQQSKSKWITRNMNHSIPNNIAMIILYLLPGKYMQPSRKTHPDNKIYQ